MSGEPAEEPCEACRSMDLKSGACHPDKNVSDTVWCAHHFNSTIVDCLAAKDAENARLRGERDEARKVIRSMLRGADPNWNAAWQKRARRTLKTEA